MAYFSNREVCAQGGEGIYLWFSLAKHIINIPYSLTQYSVTKKTDLIINTKFAAIDI